MLDNNKENNLTADKNEQNIINNFKSRDNETDPSDSPFSSLLKLIILEMNTRKNYSLFKTEQLQDIDNFVEKSGKSENEFVRDTMDVVFSQLKEINN